MVLVVKIQFDIASRFAFGFAHDFCLFFVSFILRWLLSDAKFLEYLTQDIFSTDASGDTS